MNSKLKITLYTLMLSVLFIGCSDDDGDSSSTGSGGTSSTAPLTYTFESQFSEGTSSVKYTGQVVRNLLIKDIKAAVAAGGATATDLNVYYENSDENATIATSDSYTASQTTYHEISDSKLSNKIASAADNSFPWNPSSNVYGYEMSAPDLIADWFAHVESSGGQETTDGLRLDQMIAKGLAGMVSYYQGTSVYLHPDKLDGADNSVSANDDYQYTSMEHYWDESFGYFGASRDYNVLADDDARKTYSDTDADGSIDYTSEFNFDWAAYAAKRDDCDGCDHDGSNGFTEAIMGAYLEGRHLITTGASVAEVRAQVTIIQNNWEKVIAANIVHYINSVISDIETGSSDMNKHWAEMRAFAVCLQFNYAAMISDSDLQSMASSMGTVPPTDTTGYAATLESIKDMLGTTYGFTANDLANW